MKKSFHTLLLCLLLAASLTSCKETGGSSSVSSETDSSHVSINYTDTGDNESFGNSSLKIEHSSVVESRAKDTDASSKNASSKNSSSEKETKSSKDSSSKNISSSQSSVSNVTTRTIITYYYDDEGEHSTDIEVETDEDAEESSSEQESSSSTTSVSADTETDTDTETNKDNNEDTDTDIESETDTSSDINSDIAISDGEFSEDDLLLHYSEAVIKYGDDIADIVKKIGEPLHIDSIPNENNPEFDKKTYSFDHFAIDTIPSEDGAVYTVTGMQIYDDVVSTDKGVKVGMTADEAVAVYGNDMVIYGDEYRYYIGQQYMYLYISNGLIANIGFGYDNDISVTTE